jgi:hypothetical protein
MLSALTESIRMAATAAAAADRHSGGASQASTVLQMAHPTSDHVTWRHSCTYHTKQLRHHMLLTITIVG